MLVLVLVWCGVVGWVEFIRDRNATIYFVAIVSYLCFKFRALRNNKLTYIHQSSFTKLSKLQEL